MNTEKLQIFLYRARRAMPWALKTFGFTSFLIGCSVLVGTGLNFLAFHFGGWVAIVAIALFLFLCCFVFVYEEVKKQEKRI